MLKLKKLQILGFKSFCDRTELKFHGDGIAAIVGPNGCGKSNISDAISWVLGEQSAKSLRGAHMTDVIFAGTRQRKPTGMAEVTLHLIDPQEYEGRIAAPVIEIQNEMTDHDWDESALNAQREREVDEYTEEVRPGQTDEMEVAATTDDSSAGTPAVAQEAEGSGEPGSHAAMSSQQVVLKIRRRKFKTTFKKGEVAVTRRLFRSGESEYLLNGKLCRLRDIQDIFMGTGLGPESYALIEQGRIGQILELQADRPPQHHRRGCRNHQVQNPQASGRSAPGRRQAEPRPHQRHLRRSHPADEFAEAPGGQGRALCQAAR